MALSKDLWQIFRSIILAAPHDRIQNWYALWIELTCPRRQLFCLWVCRTRAPMGVALEWQRRTRSRGGWMFLCISPHSREKDRSFGGWTSLQCRCGWLRFSAIWVQNKSHYLQEWLPKMRQRNNVGIKKIYPKIHLNKWRPQPIVDVWIGQVAHYVCPPVYIFLEFREWLFHPSGCRRVGPVRIPLPI